MFFHTDDLCGRCQRYEFSCNLDLENRICMKIHSVFLCMTQRLYDFLTLKRLVSEHRFVVLRGPMGCGKTTLARMLPHSLYLDGRSPPDRNLLADPSADLQLRDGPVIIDDAERVPGLQPILLRLADRNPGLRFLLVGPVEPPPGNHPSFRLDGLRPWDVGGGYLDSLWFRGGYPASFHSVTDLESVAWRQTHVLQATETLCPLLSTDPNIIESRRFLSMLAYRHGRIRNSCEIARSFQSSEFLVRSWCRKMEDGYLIRCLKPWRAETGQRQIRREKVYIRDSGILHSLLGIEDRRQLLSHPACAASWEGFALEWIAASIGKTDADLFHWGTSNGNAIHLVWKDGGRLWGVSLHYGCNPPRKHHQKEAVRILGLEHLWFVYTGRRSFNMHHRCTVIPLMAVGPRWDYAMKIAPEASRSPAQRT
jgi:uncharacterized protein